MFKHYLTTALRHFRQHKLTTSINVACLAMGLVCFIFAYGVVDYFRESDSYHEKAARTYVLTESVKIGGERATPSFPRTSLAVAPLIKSDFPTLELVARAGAFNNDVTLAADGKTQFVRAAFADGELLTIFDVPFVAGDSRNALMQPHSAVITQAVAQQLFGSRDPMGQAIVINNRETVHVSGVIAEPKQPSHMSTLNANAALYFQVLVSMDVNEALIRATDPPELAAHKLNLPYGFMWYQTYVVLPVDGSVTLVALNSQLKSFSSRHVSKTASNVEITITARPVSDVMTIILDAVMQTDKTGLSATSMLFALGALILAIAALNYANLASAQAATRSKEVALRRVVGASRVQVTLQHLCEASLLVTLALALTLLTVVALKPTLDGPLRIALSMMLFNITSLHFLGFIIVLVVTVSLLASIYPVLVLARVKPAFALRGGRMKGSSRFMSSFFVGAQFFAASFLLIAVIVMSDQNRLLSLVGLGAGDDPVIAINNDVRSSGINMEVLRTELLRHPQVQSVTATMFSLGIVANDTARVFLSKDPNAKQTTTPLQLVDYDFFNAMQIKVLAGRVFDHAYGNDASVADSQHSSGNIVIDIAFAQRMGWPTAQEALGKTVYVPGLANGPEPVSPSTIIGVVANKPLFAINMGGTGTIYQLVPTLVSHPLIRISKTDVAGALTAIDSVWKQVAPNTALQRRFLDEQFAQGLLAFDVVAGVFGRLAIFALIISSVGLMGMAAHIVGRRRHEIGVRKTLGASVRQVLLLLLKDFSKPVVIANLVAWPLAFAAMTVYLSIFVTRTSLSIAPFIGSLLLTLAIAWLAVGLQAVRAARVNPATVMRYE